MVFWAYLITRLFVHSKTQLLDGDEVRHLKTAKTFYKFWNNDFYDYHPPLYAFLTKQFRSGVVVSLASSLLLYPVMLALLKEMGLSLFLVPYAMCFITFNYLLIFYSNRVFRYSLFVLLTTYALLLLLQKHYLWCGVVWGLAGLTCSFGALRFFWVWFVVSFFKGFNIAPLVFLPIYGCWIMAKFNCYKKNLIHPSGPEGKADIVYPLTLRRLLSPLYFPLNYSYYGKDRLKKDYANVLYKLGNLFAPRQHIDSIWVVFLTAILLVVTVWGMFKSPLWVTLTILLLVWNTTNKYYNPRNSIMVLPLLAYCFAKGMGVIPSQWLNFAFWGIFKPFDPLEWVTFGSVVFLCLNHRTIWGRIWGLKGVILAQFLDSLPYDGILADSFIDYYLAYCCKKRVIALTHNPDISKAIDETDLAIDKFDINYFVLSRNAGEEIDTPARLYVKQCFNHIKTIDEDGDKYYVYQVRKGRLCEKEFKMELEAYTSDILSSETYWEQAGK